MQMLIQFDVTENQLETPRLYENLDDLESNGFVEGWQSTETKHYVVYQNIAGRDTVLVYFNADTKHLYPQYFNNPKFKVKALIEKEIA